MFINNIILILFSGSLFDIQAPSSAMFSEHTAELCTGNQKRCFLCLRTGTKTRSGWDVFTRYKCSQCDVPLCYGGYSNRNCFVLFHSQHPVLSHTEHVSNQ